MNGKRINGFELKRRLGVGGMAEVWYAENSIGKKAAVKLLLPKLCEDESIVKRFITEAKVTVELLHPNIRQVYDFGEIDGRPTIVQEYLDGDDLKALMKSGRTFTETELVKWWNQLASALNYTHAHGVVHRDIKPSNIFIDNNDDVKLMDFGIAKIGETGSGTRTGSMLGTMLYMSPEQVKDPKRIGPKSDNYSLAVSFVHLLTGKAPYDSTTNSDFDIQLQIVSKNLDLSKVPDNWRNFLLPYLEKDPDKRAELKPFGNNVSAATSTKPAAPVFTSDETCAENIVAPKQQQPSNADIYETHVDQTNQSKTASSSTTTVMVKNKESYKSAVTKTFNGVLIYIGVTIISVLLSAYLIANNPMSAFMVLGLLFALIASGMSMYYRGLKDLEKCLDNAEDSNAVKKLSLSALISIAINIIMAMFYFYVNSNLDINTYQSALTLDKVLKFVGLVPLVLNIIGFSYLKKSVTFPGDSGANSLYISSIMSLVANILLVIPYINIIGSLLALVAFILYLVGWSKIKNSWKTI